MHLVRRGHGKMMAVSGHNIGSAIPEKKSPCYTQISWRYLS